MKHKVIVTKILRIQVCSTGTIDEALEWVRENHPAGTTNNWCKQDNEKLAPVDCEDPAEQRGRKHYIFEC
jgi:hypothetical protein